MGSINLPTRRPEGPLYRIGRRPHAWRAPDRTIVGDDGTFGNRFDILAGSTRVLYASSSPLGCFVETLARYRISPTLDLRSALEEIENADDENPPIGKVPVSWLAPRLLGQAVSNVAFADLYCAEWVSYLRRHYADHDLDLSSIASTNRKFTQGIATIVQDLGFEGIYYQSRHGSNLFNWALFEPFELELAASTAILPDNPDFQRALTLLSLALDPTL